MSLLEVLLGGVLFLGSSAASLLVWSQAVEAMAAEYYDFSGNRFICSICKNVYTWIRRSTRRKSKTI